MAHAKANDRRSYRRSARAEHDARDAVRRRPFSSRACHELGMVLLERGRPDEAVELMRRSVALGPAAPVLRINLAAALGCAGRHQDVLGELAQAMMHGGGAAPELHNQLGISLRALGRLEESAAAFANALSRRPNFPEAHFGLGSAMLKLGNPAGAIPHFREALRLRPGHFRASWELARAAGELGDAEYAVEIHRRLVDTYPRSAASHSALLYTLHYLPALSRAGLLDEARRWADRHGRFAEAGLAHDNDRDADRRLRIGYLSPDFRRHTIAHLIEPLLEAHDPERFEVHCYSAVLAPDAMTRRLEALANIWVDVSRASNADAARRIRDDRVDILVDLAGHMGDHRLGVVARRPAPIQVQLGYAGTTGFDAVDYRITDAHCDPPGADEFYSEKLIRLPDCAWLYKPSEGSPEAGPLPVLANRFVTFGCLNKTIKITGETIAAWCEVLAALPSSRLLVLSPPGNTHLLSRFALRGIDPGRLELAAPRPRDEYLRLFNRIDIALDPFPYNGDTTTCDGLWMGVPLVTLAGDAFVSRRGVSHLMNVGLGELVAENATEYAGLAVTLASEPRRLASIRAGLRERMRQSPLTNGPRYAANLEAAYRRAWQEWCART